MDIKQGGLFHHRSLSDKERKNLAILELIRKNGPISRTDISHTTDINIVSISNYIKDYIAKGIVIETGCDVSTGGRRPELVELNAKGLYAVGLDIGISDIIATLTDFSINVVSKVKIPTPAGSIDEITLKAIESIEELLKKTGIEKGKIKAIGIGAACSNNRFYPAMDAIRKKFGIDVFMGSDAACAAFGERRLNPKADVEDLLYMYSDVGCGIIIRGDAYFGAGGNAGEIQISHEHISKEEELLFSMSSQYLKPWGMDLGIARMARHEIEKGIGTKIVACAKGDLKNINTEVVIEAAKQDDEIATDIVRNAGMNLGVRIAYLVNLFNPEAVVVGGGVEKAGELILDPIRKTVKKLAFSQQAGIVKIITSILGEDAVSLGAASLAVREIFLKA
ncbi:MAG: ROK family transcriptional regulator [Candidatus Omnitrophota bacterium]|jgi:predicted NBD/HSP70 family sugar kinase/predicted transcriptional regulator